MSYRQPTVVITGLAPICSLGIGREEVWDGLSNKRTGLELMDYKIHNESVGKFYKHKTVKINIDDIGLDPQLIDEMRSWRREGENEDFVCMLKAIKLVLADGSLEIGHGEQIGLIVSHENMGLESFCSNFFENLFKINSSKSKTKTIPLFNDFFLANSRRAYELQTFMPLYHIAKLFNIHGYSLFINNACSSGLYAMEAACQTILSGRNRAVIIVASDYQDIFKTLWLNEAKLYCEDGITRPFDISRKGFVSGEGGAAIILEDMAHAQRRKARIYAEYLGGGFNQDCWKVSLPRIGGGFLSRAIKGALDSAKIDIGQIDLINAHAVGTQISDKYEADAIFDVFKERISDIPVCAFKGYVGHNLGGSSLLETVLTLLVMEKCLALPTLNTIKIDPTIKINLIMQTTKLRVRQCLKICSGFGGYNSAIVLRKCNYE